MGTETTTSSVSSLRAELAALERQIDALGRPKDVLLKDPRLSAKAKFDGAWAAKKAWDAVDPQRAAAHSRLMDNWDQIYNEIKLLEQKETEEQRRDSLLRLANIGRRNLELIESQKLRPSVPIAKTKGWLGSPEAFLVLAGQGGTGKTLAAADAAYKLHNQGWRVMVFPAAAGPRMGLFGEQAEFMVGRLRSVRFLVIDDLGTEQMTEGWLSAFGDIIDCRYQSGAKTILTTNLDPETFLSRYGARVFDRLGEAGVWEECGSETQR